MSYHISRTPPYSWHSKARAGGYIDGGGRRRHTGERLGHVHHGVNVAVYSGSRTRRHDCLDGLSAGHSLRRDGDRGENSTGDDVTLGYRRSCDGDDSGVGGCCEDHVRTRVWNSLADAGFVGGCADQHAAVNGHRLVCWGGEAADAIRDTTGRRYGSCLGEIDCR